MSGQWCPMNPPNAAPNSPGTSSQVPAAPQLPSSGRRQRIRMRRFAFASTFSILFVGVLAVFYTQHMIDGKTLLSAALLVLVFVVAFFFIFRTGANLRFSDPSLTGWQFFAAVFTMLYVVYYAPETRLAFTAFFFVAV